jgi:hypothetical protein
VDNLLPTDENTPETAIPAPNKRPLKTGFNGRNSKGQFLPGSIPNHKGRPIGSRNRATLLARALLEERAGALTRKVMDEAISAQAMPLCAIK